MRLMANVSPRTSFTIRLTPLITFDLKIARTGRVIRVATDQTALGALADAGIDVPHSCSEGVCGTCLTAVLEGEIDHRDSVLTPEQGACNDQFTPCCSRARGKLLVLDL
jgi:vanillate monooxygenase ferredoxin subunit